MESKEQAAKTIVERIGMLFKPKANSRYTISAVNDVYDKTYNFFFVSQKAYKREKSTPIHTVEDYDLETFEHIIKAIKEKYGFTIEFYGFTDELWPSTGKPIQRKKHSLE